MLRNNLQEYEGGRHCSLTFRSHCCCLTFPGEISLVGPLTIKIIREHHHCDDNHHLNFFPILCIDIKEVISGIFFSYHERETMQKGAVHKVRPAIFATFHPLPCHTLS